MHWDVPHDVELSADLSGQSGDDLVQGFRAIHSLWPGFILYQVNGGSLAVVAGLGTPPGDFGVEGLCAYAQPGGLSSGAIFPTKDEGQTPTADFRHSSFVFGLLTRAFQQVGVRRRLGGVRVSSGCPSKSPRYLLHRSASWY